jgi:serine/threonine protein kinase
MDYVDGGSLWDLMKGGRQAIELGIAAPFILQMLEGLAYAHEAELTVTTTEGKRKQIGVIHRDLKPPNVMLARSGADVEMKLDVFLKCHVAQLSDFGLAKAFGAAGCTQGSLSQSGTVCGSPPYMAPEHLTNYKYVKPATDVFEMAATIFHMLTGQTVRSLGQGRDPFKCVLEERPRRLKDYLKGCPKELNAVMERALAVDPKDRYQNGRWFLDAMRRAL